MFENQQIAEIACLALVLIIVKWRVSGFRLSIVAKRLKIARIDQVCQTAL